MPFEIVLEEYYEVLSATDSNDRIEELADMLEVMIALAKLEGKKLDEIIEICKNKGLKRGGFEDKIFLEKVLEE